MRRLRFGAAIAQSNFMRLTRPYKVLLALTSHCNGRCLTCNIWQQAPGPELGLDEIETLFTKNSHFSWVNLTGGEILLRRDLPDILEHILTGCKDLCLLNFATNGSLPQVAEKVVREMPRPTGVKTAVTVSVDGPEERNDRIRGTSGGFRKSIETFTRLRELGHQDLRVLFGITLSDHNAGMLEETFQALRQEVPSLTYGDIHINVAHASPQYYANGDGGCLAWREEIRRDVGGLREKQPPLPLDAMRWLEKGYLRHLGTFLETRKTPVQCQALSASCFITFTGTVYPCIIFDRPLGNLREEDFDLDRIWKRQESVALRQDIRNGRCPNCWLACEAYQSILGRPWA